MNPGRLDGRRILVTRPAAQADGLAAAIAAHGGEAVVFPLLEISPPADDSALREASRCLAEYAIAVFVSPNAVDFAMPFLLSAGPWPAGVLPAAIGQSTVGRLAEFGVSGTLAPTLRFDSEALLELPAFAAERVKGRKVLILRGNGGRELLAETLIGRGATVVCVSCYKRSAPADGGALLSLLRNNGLDALTVSSSEGLRNLLALLDTEAVARLKRLPLFVPHQRIAEVAAELGLQAVVLTSPADAGIVAGLCAFHWPDRA